MRLIKIVGTINTHHECEDILRKALEAGAFNAAIMSREIALEVSSARLKKVRDTLHLMNVSDIKIREESAIESTVSHSGHGQDAKKFLKISLAPGTRVTGLKFVSFMFSDKFRRESITDPAILISNLKKVISDTLKKTCVTDVLICVEFRQVVENVDSAVESATVNALIDADGIVQVTI